MLCKLILDCTEGHILREASPTEGHPMTLLLNTVALHSGVKIAEFLPVFIKVRQHLF